MNEKAAQDVVEAVTRLDVITIAALLLVALFISLKYIIIIKLKSIDQKIIDNQNDITDHKKTCEDYIQKAEKKILGVESMAASAGLRLQRVQSDLTNHKAIQSAHIDRTDKDINKLDSRLLRIEETINTNHKKISDEVKKISESVAVLISKSE